MDKTAELNKTIKGYELKLYHFEKGLKFDKQAGLVDWKKINFDHFKIPESSMIIGVKSNGLNLWMFFREPAFSHQPFRF